MTRSSYPSFSKSIRMLNSCNSISSRQRAKMMMKEQNSSKNARKHPKTSLNLMKSSLRTWQIFLSPWQIMSKHGKVTTLKNKHQSWSTCQGTLMLKLPSKSWSRQSDLCQTLNKSVLKSFKRLLRWKAKDNWPSRKLAETMLVLSKVGISPLLSKVGISLL